MSLNRQCLDCIVILRCILFVLTASFARQDIYWCVHFQVPALAFFCFCLCLYKLTSLVILFLQSLQILTPNMDARRLFTETTELAKHTSVCRRNWRTVRDVEEEGRWRTALPFRRRSLAIALPRRTFTMALEGKGWTWSRSSSVMPWPAQTRRQAEEKMASREVRMFKGWRFVKIHSLGWHRSASLTAAAGGSKGSATRPTLFLITRTLTAH